MRLEWRGVGIAGALLVVALLTWFVGAVVKWLRRSVEKPVVTGSIPVGGIFFPFPLGCRIMKFLRASKKDSRIGTRKGRKTQKISTFVVFSR